MDRTPLPPVAKENIETIVQMEQRLLGRHSPMERTGTAIARFFGSPRFIAAQALFLAAWVFLNLGWLPILEVFDPYPFSFLNFILGAEFIFLTTFVLMNQSLQSRRQEHWAHLNLQVCLLTEQEVTKNMQMLQQLCKRWGALAVDQEVQDLVQKTEVPVLLDEIERAWKDGEAPEKVEATSVAKQETSDIHVAGR